MDGITLAKICDVECQKRGISKAQFYKDIGVSAPSFHQDIYTEVDKDAIEAERKKIEDYARKRGVLSKVLSKPANPHES